MNTKFPVLSFVSSVLRFFGWSFAIVGLLYGGWNGVIEPNLPEHFFNASSNGVKLVGGIVGMFFGIITIAIGELIGVLFAIEENTRKH